MKPHPATKLWSLGSDENPSALFPRSGHSWDSVLRAHREVPDTVVCDLQFATRLEDVRTILGVK